MSLREAMVKVHTLNKKARESLGHNSEDRVDQALNLLIENGLIATAWNSSGDEDRKFGIDRHIQLQDGRIIDLQIKSSDFGVNEAKNRFPHIPVIKFIEDEDLESLSNRIRGLIQAKLKGKF